MALAYTEAGTQTLDKNNIMITNTSEVTGLGAIVQVIVESDIVIPNLLSTGELSKKEKTINAGTKTFWAPSISAADLSGLTYTFLGEVEQEANDKVLRQTYAYSVAGKGSIVLLVVKVNYKENNKAKTVYTITDAYWAPGTERDGADLNLGVTSGLGTPWFVWNGENLSQFDTEVDGSHVTTSTWSAVLYGGVYWISGNVTSDGSAGHNIAEAGSFLKISATPPTQDNIIVADFISWSYSVNYVGAMVLPRFTSTSDAAYACFGQSGGLTPHEIGKFSTSETVTPLGDAQDDPNTLTQQESGIRLGMGAEGNTVLTGMFGERQIIVDTSGDISQVGVPAIGVAPGSTASANSAVRFRNIRCYTIGELGVGG